MELGSQLYMELVTGTSARCRPDATKEKIRKVDTDLHGIFYRAIYKETRV